MRWAAGLSVVALGIGLLAACDDATQESNTAQKATPDNTAEAECRLIKECNDELQRRSQEKQDQFWDADPNKKIEPPKLDATQGSTDTGQGQQPQPSTQPAP